MSHREYIELLRGAAAAHVDIGHGESAMHFARIALNAHPMLRSASDIDEFIRHLGQRLKYPALLAVSYKANYKASGDAHHKLMDGAFILLDKHLPKNADSEEAALSRLEGMGEEIIGYLEAHVGAGALLDLNNVESEQLTKISTTALAGVKFYFTLQTSTRALIFNKDKFN